MQLIFVYFITFHKALVTCVLLNYVVNFGNSCISESLKELMLVFWLGVFTQIF